MKNTFAMKTATTDDLVNRLPTILAWLEAGEDVVVKPRSASLPATTASKPQVDWSQSVAFRDRTGERTLNAEETVELSESIKGDN